jgi:hypothetical protein
MHTALILKEQPKAKKIELREKGLDHSVQHIKGYDFLWYKEKIYIPQSLRVDSNLTGYSFNPCKFQ